MQKLTKGRYQDNLEFLQWMRGYVDSHRTVESSGYDGIRRRVTAVIRNCIANNTNAHLTLGSVTSALPAWAQDGVTVPLIKECLAHVKSASATSASDRDKLTEGKEHDTSRRQGSSDLNLKQVVRGMRSTSSSISGHEAKSRRIVSTNTNRIQQSDSGSRTSSADTHVKECDSGNTASRSVSVETSAPTQYVEQLQSEKQRNNELESLLTAQKKHAEALRLSLEERDRTIAAMQEQVDSLKKQLGQVQADKQVAKMSKDFYYNKLRRIEILCQKCEGGRLEVAPLFDIMYATDNVV